MDRRRKPQGLGLAAPGRTKFSVVTGGTVFWIPESIGRNACTLICTEAEVINLKCATKTHVDKDLAVIAVLVPGRTKKSVFGDGGMNCIPASTGRIV
jgi:hypothetical protein